MMGNVDSAFSQKRRLTNYELVNREQVSGSSHNQSDEAKLALGREYRPGRPETAFLIRPSGEVLKGLDAFLPLVPNLPGGKLLLWW